MPLPSARQDGRYSQSLFTRAAARERLLPFALDCAAHLSARLEQA